MPKLKCTVSLSLVGCHKTFEVEYDEDDVEGMGDGAKEKFFAEIAEEAMWERNLIDLDWKEAE